MPFRSRVREMTLPFPTHCRARHPHKKAQGGRWLWHAMLLGLEFLLGKVTLRLPKPGWSSGGPPFSGANLWLFEVPARYLPQGLFASSGA